MRTAIGLLLLLACDSPAPPTSPPAEIPPPPLPPPAPLPVEPAEPTETTPPAPVAKPEGGPFGEAMNRALAASRRNDAPAAEAAYREALKTKPNDAGALAGLAETLFAQNRQPDAIAMIEKAWEIAPDNPQVRWTFGIIMLTNKKRMTEAVAAWEALAKENPEYAEPMGVPERLKEIKKYMEPSGSHGKSKAPR